MEKFAPISDWLERGDQLKSLLAPETALPDTELGGFLVLDKAIPLHETVNLEPESLASSWELAHQYLERCKEVIDVENPEWIDNYEVSLIQEELGDPPSVAYPIYIISTKEESGPEMVVYIGKTSSKTNRFGGGHAAISKLHAPKFEGLEKWLYPACVILLTKNKCYLPLEWISPLPMAEKLLTSIEAQLINSFKPLLNTHHITRKNSVGDPQIHIQNFANESRFLNDEFV